jgi:diguanylate cyclase (GGDEF)-like protein
VLDLLNMTTKINRLDEVHAHLASLFECSPLLVSVYDDTDTLRYANPMFRTVLGIDADDFSTWQSMMRRNHARRVGTQVDSADFEIWLASARSRRGKLPFRGFESDLTDGRWYYMTETVDAQGWMLCCAFDITALRADERSLRVARDGALKAAQTDTLTGISNRFHILQLLDLQLETSRQRKHSCGIVMLDLDHFKAVNDVHGHHGGDLVLKHFATMTGASLRSVDGFGRLGGEEFMVLLPGIDESQLKITVERLLAEVRQARPLPDAPDFSYTCSAGAGMLNSVEDAVDNIRRVDRALYQAKSQGRDRCVMLTSA